jgi:hypothetical protein
MACIARTAAEVAWVTQGVPCPALIADPTLEADAAVGTMNSTTVDYDLASPAQVRKTAS